MIFNIPVHFKEFNCIEGKEEFFPFGFHPQITLSSDNKTIYTTTGENSIDRLDLKTGELIKTLISLKHHKKNINTFAISEEDNFILTSSFEDPLRLWDLNTGNLITTLNYNDIISKVFISHENKQIFAYGEKKNLYLWNYSSVLKLKRFRCNSHSIKISPDGNSFLGVSSNSEIKLFDLKDGGLIREFMGHKSWITYINFTPDGKNIVSVSNDNTIKVWDVETMEVLREVEIYEPNSRDDEDFVITGILSPDGHYIAVPIDDYLKIWDIYTMELIQCIPFKVSYITGNAQLSLTYSNDGNFLVMSDGDRIYVWNRN